jgi:hypothetical protein
MLLARKLTNWLDECWQASSEAGMSHNYINPCSITLDSRVAGKVTGKRSSVPNWHLGQSEEKNGGLTLRVFRTVVALAFADDGCPQLGAQVVWKFVEMGLPVNLDGHLRGVANHVAVMAPLKMVFQFGFGLGIHRPIEVIG